ncbi:MAG: hypothetical protein WC867_00650 [Candidatus Pacearchaeota archaeon]|jgi:hypothetical protein
MVKFNIHVSNRILYTILTILIIVGIGQIVYAYNTNNANPISMGHSLNEIEMPPGCLAGQALIRNPSNNGWICSGSGSGSGQCFVNHVTLATIDQPSGTVCTCPQGWSKPDLSGAEELGVIHYCAWSNCLGGQHRPLGMGCAAGECDQIVGKACLCCR